MSSIAPFIGEIPPTPGCHSRFNKRCPSRPLLLLVISDCKRTHASGEKFLGTKGKERTQFAASAAATTACGGRRGKRRLERAAEGNRRRKSRTSEKKRREEETAACVDFLWCRPHSSSVLSPPPPEWTMFDAGVIYVAKKPRLFYLPPLFSVIVSRSFSAGEKIPTCHANLLFPFFLLLVVEDELVCVRTSDRVG